MNRGKCRRKFSRSALFLFALLELLGAARSSGGGCAAALAGLPQVLCHSGHHEGDHRQDQKHQKAGLLVVGIEQGLQNIAHRTVPFRSRRNRSEERGYSQMLPFSSGFMGAAMTASTMVMAAEKPVQKVARYSTPKTGRLA